MEFERVVAKRRMVRAFNSEAVDRREIDRIIGLAIRSPSAGNTQGWHFLVLEGSDQTAKFWDVSLPAEKRPTFRWQHLLDAPVLIIPLADPQMYVGRYGEPDKAKTGLGAGADRWSTPYWLVDTAFATMTLLHAVVDAGLGALFFGLFDREDEILAAFGVPSYLQALGAIAIGHPATEQAVGRSESRVRRDLGDVIHRGYWSK